ncbi:unnamed protein product [Dibothriocephalus latus]|uniref:Uncharacterized protein n=1 Tax=Dibothriocephalus latus TaxID=60516 RepID=A0A3P7NIY9_DIBLA|nr:unnamed protein product [Dibothriocephalus latus]
MLSYLHRSDVFPLTVHFYFPLPIQSEQRKPKRRVGKPKPRYLIRITKIEHDSEGCETGNLRPTFYLEMPDLNNPSSETWKFSFRCNLSDTTDDIKLPGLMTQSRRLGGDAGVY